MSKIVVENPAIKEIDYQDPLLIFSHFSEDSWSMFLDSADALINPLDMNRYSYIAIDPFIKITCKNKLLNVNGKQVSCVDPLSYINEQLNRYHIVANPSCPPFQGGLMGYFAYDLCHYIDNIPYPNIDDMEFDDIAVGIYDLVISFDHQQKRAWIISTGLSASDLLQQEKCAELRLNRTLEKLKKHTYSPAINQNTIAQSHITSNFTRSSYKAAVVKMANYIREGDIFEANMTQRFTAPLPENLPPFDLYRRLRKINPAPFAAYLNLDNTVIASMSPERFLFLDKDGIIETRPIKGTRPRGKTEAEDIKLANELQNSKKDWAENIMIVDLMRNDLSKVCEDNTITVPQLCGLETFTSVHHLVSVVKGKIKKDKNAIDLLKATFPGGSITGAPKIRAMEIIAELEPNRRGPYCGSIGYMSFDGCLDTSIVIRTYAIKNNIVTFQAGGAVVLDSDPETEYEETLHKARALHSALTESSS